MSATVITTVQDYLGYGHISGQACHGHTWCVQCRGELQPASSSGDKGKSKSSSYFPPSCFTLDQAELAQVFKCLDGIKVTSCYSGLVRRYLDTKKHRFSGMKSHDCHVM